MGAIDGIFMAVDGGLAYVADALDWLFSLDQEQFIRVFWATVFLDLPRYMAAYFIVLFLFLRDRPHSRPELANAAGHQPLVSVVVAALNERDIVAANVRSLLEQSYPNVEVIVVDDGSTDGTFEAAQEMADSEHVTVVRLPERQGKSAAVNHGTALAAGEIIVYMDADSTLERDAINDLVAYFDDPRVGAVSGDLGVRNQFANLLTRFQAMEYLLGLSMGRRFKAAAGILSIVPGAIGAFRADLVERVGGKDPGPSDDTDLTVRMRKLSKRVVMAGEAVCYTTVPDSWRRWFYQRMRWDRGIVRMKVRKHRDAYNPTNASFSLSTALSFLDVLFFAAVLPAGWLIYLADMLRNYPGELGQIFIGVAVIQVVLTCLGLAIAMIVTARRFDVFDALFTVPLFTLYAAALKVVRVAAMTQEILFKSSYRDPFAPEKVRANAEIF